MNIISYDLGTGGVKASLYGRDMRAVSKVFIEYPTYYPKSQRHEQRPQDWWDAVAKSTERLLRRSGTDPREIECVSLSGASLVAVPMDSEGRPLLEQVPIWSDSRAGAEAEDFFRRIDRDVWYMTTGNGFPAPCYSIFKLMWMKSHQPEIFEKTAFVLGSKDYVNYRLTGEPATDFSYASGTGAFDLRDGAMRGDFLEAAGLPPGIFLKPVPSHQVIGRVTHDAARETGLYPGTAVVCGGVDNACMALGAVGAEPGRVFVSLGSSSWIPVNSSTPILDSCQKPYVFAHIQEGMFTSAFSIFAGGSSLRWARETFCRELSEEGAYRQMDCMAERSPAGAGGVFFNPALAGGTSQDKSPHIRGSFMGLHLGTTRDDMIRAVMEGVAMSLRRSYESLRREVDVSGPLLFCGGGSKSRTWMQMFANVFDTEVCRTSIDQDAASLGAAAAAARGVGWWRDYSPIHSLHKMEYRGFPQPAAVAAYDQLIPLFEQVCAMASELGDKAHVRDPDEST